MFKKIIFIILIGIAFTWNVYAQCKGPFVPSFSERSSSAIKISWLDNNTTPMAYQLAYGEKGINIQNAIKSGLLPVKNIKLENLTSGTSYNFWLRTICGVGDSSTWVGPYAFTTYITNPSPCEMKIDIKDNSCSNNSGDVFIIEVDLGNNASDYVLQSVSLIVQHTWPADLKIELESPTGETVLLTQFNGTVSDNFGVVASDCSQPAIFSDEACLSIKESSPPFVGSFIPEEPLSDFNVISNKNGLWKLRICDDAFNDRGILKYVKLNFEEFSCSYVHQYYISKVNDKSYKVTWQKPDNCVNMQIYYRKKGTSIYDRKIVNCDSLNATIDGLVSDAEYEFYMVSNCGGTNTSTPSCIYEFKTQCSAPKLYENFDAFNVCEPSCASPCNFESFIFNTSMDGSDWLVNVGETPTIFTGPLSGAYKGGQYIYIESNPLVCGPNVSSILETKCLKATSSGAVCDLNFFYHMYGSDLGRLSVDKSTDGKTWNTIFTKEGESNNSWLNENITLNQNVNTTFRLRFTGTTKEGVQSDIGLDEISISNGIVTDDIVYYYDQDGDGYGDNDSTQHLCTSIVPINFSVLNGDCNDRNPEVNPARTDLPCNLIDENCDGIIELEDINNPMILESVVIKDESCRGKKDGGIDLSISGGTLPYSFLWNNNEVIEDISDIGQGSYISRITDANGCGLITDSIHINVVSDFTVTVNEIILPSCFGKADGKIMVSHNSSFPPFIFKWNNGSIVEDLENVTDGKYFLSVTDAIGCLSISDEINIESEQTFNAISTLKRNPFCFGQANGILEVQAFNGIPPYLFEWKDGSTGNKRLNLTDGLYEVLITDQSGCKIIHKDSLIEPALLDIKLLNVEPARCFGNQTGIIKTQTSGGTPPFNYRWKDGGPPTEIRNNLPADIYYVTVSDFNGCKDSIRNILVAQPPKLNYSIDSINNSSCLAKKDGKIFTTVNGGVIPYDFYWNGVDQFTEDVDSLLAGSYTLTVLDANRCKLTTEAVDVLSFNTASDIEIEILDKNICPGENIAAIKASILSNSYPLDFNWSNGSQHFIEVSVDTINKLPSGTYNVTITDDEGCVSVSNNVNIEFIPPFNPIIDIIRNICKEDSLGEITVVLSGGSQPYDYQWSNGENSNVIDLLPNGHYSFMATDRNFCKYQSQLIELGSISNLSCDITFVNSINGLNNGSCIISPKGGLGNYVIDWEFPLFEGFVIDSLAPSKYKFTFTDDAGCSIDSFVIIDAINLVQDVDQLLVDVYPNPVVDNLTIVNYLQKRLEISLYSPNGLRLKTAYNNQPKFTFDVSDVPEGLYYLRLSDEVFATVYKIVIMR